MRHTLVVLEPGHFHAALALAERHPAVADEVWVYADPGPEVNDFLALVESFNRRRERPTAWRPVLRRGGDPLDRLIAEPPAGAAVIVAGRNDVKAGQLRRLHDAGLPVLADKPWLAGPEGLDDVRHVLSGGPLAMEMMTGRHDVAAGLLQRLVREPAVFGGFRPDDGGDAGIALASVHHLAKTVNGAPLRRPPWFFDVRVQGDGLADIPTHLVDQAQRLVAGATRERADGVELVTARRWATAVPRALFQRVTGRSEFPPDLGDAVQDGVLAYLGNGELRARLGGVTLHLTTRWALAAPPGGGDTHRAVLRGARSTIRLEQDAATGFQRRVVVQPLAEPEAVRDALERAVRAWTDLPGVAVMSAPDGLELAVPAVLRTGHEGHFALVLRDFLDHLARGDRLAAAAADTLAKYTLLARAGEVARAAPPEAGASGLDAAG